MDAPAAPAMVAATGGVTGDWAHFVDPTGKYRLVSAGSVGVAVEARLTAAEGLKSEAGAMITKHADVDIDADCDGGCFTACFRSCLGGEACCFNHYSIKGKSDGASGGALDVLLAPKMPGEVLLVNVTPEAAWRLQHGAYLGGDENVNVHTVFQGLYKGCCSGEGCFVLRLEGGGRALLNSYGSIVRYDLAHGEVRVVDNGSMVAWTESMDYKIGLASQKGGMLTKLVKSAASGEGIVCRFTGPGTVFVQTRSFSALARTARCRQPDVA